MSQDDIERLIADRSLARAEFDDEDVAAFWEKTAASYADAHITGISSDGAFQRAQTAALRTFVPSYLRTDLYQFPDFRVH